MNPDSFADKARQWDTQPLVQKMTQLFADRIKTHVALGLGLEALEFGCGTGLVSMRLRDKLGKITLLDNSPAMLDVLRDKIATQGIENMTVHCGDIFDLDLPAGQFDLIYTLMALHHVPDTQAIIAHFYRLLKPGGYLAIGDLETEDGSFHSEPIDVHHGFDVKVLRETCQAQGLDVVTSQLMHIIRKPDQDDNMIDYGQFFLLTRRLPASPPA